MELHADFLQLQGILKGLSQNIGQFTRLKTKSGYENEFSAIMQELLSYFRAKTYFINDKINEEFSENLLKIVRFFTVNTAYSSPLKTDSDIAHLRGIIPELSVCLLVNIISNFELDKLLCKVFKENLLSIENMAEILHELHSYLRKCKPKKKLRKTMIYFNVIVDLMLSKSALTDWHRINETSKAMMYELARFSVDDVRQWKQADLAAMMGFTCLNLFKLLLRCNKHNQLSEFIENLIASIVFVLRSLTLDIYCEWVEIEKDGKPLQSLVSELAYRVSTDYATYGAADELRGMLTTIARKPKTIAEQIREASPSTIIEHVYKGDDNQKRWLHSLIYGNLSFGDASTLQCIADHAHLCSVDVIYKLLSTYVLNRARNCSELTIDDQRVTDVILKCACALNTDDLIQLLVKHFFNNGLVCLDAANAHAKFTELLNRLTSADDTTQSKDILILILSDPKSILKLVFAQCLRNSFYTHRFQELFAQLRDIFLIQNVGGKVLEEVCAEFDSAEVEANSVHFVRLFDVLTCDTNGLSIDTIWKMAYYQIHRGYVDKQWMTVLNWLRILKALKSKIHISDETKSLFELILKLMHENRCQFLHFNAIYMEIVAECVDIISNRLTSDINSSEIFDSCDTSDRFANYYVTCLKTNMPHCFTATVYGYFDPSRHAEAVTKLLEILPLCVKCEWQLTGREIQRNSDIDKLLKLLTDFLILLCTVVSNQESNGGDLTALCAALKYCLENFAFVVQDLLTNNDCLNFEQQVVKQICRLLRKLPNSCKEEFGLLLIGGSLMTERALKSLASDKEFVVAIAAIENANICKVLAQKMLG